MKCASNQPIRDKRGSKRRTTWTMLFWQWHVPDIFSIKKQNWLLHLMQTLTKVVKINSDNWGSNEQNCFLAENLLCAITLLLGLHLFLHTLTYTHTYIYIYIYILYIYIYIYISACTYCKFDLYQLPILADFW